ncbi:hypothetical protein FT663_00850 [Candidozyma haemuli var. vulneris]|uniref:Uncharacterized protein n=1 Tax=Candidozyma haemuli TaxID=45357 RepID=A0A2V1AVY4_9ASCO|nr:hypothetical protein CXQ85_004619 [[Candida] haemuloni]KAF3986233.1 hypothetical protein FT662_04672 [[Candida] haemuloni var. vulneris]KAF3995014.1 hypothetical protein FT663_00850 [[Candida] haemuloni var. vulneris]PVH21954.1 hypothetical protein CXQ85_004619 [[Candida] haemuloni]
MEKYRYETFYVFEEFVSEFFSLSKVASSALKALSKDSSKYCSHNTRLYHYEDKVLAITEFRVKFEDDARELEVISSKDEKFNDVIKPGKEERIVECKIVKPRNLTRFNEEKSFHDNDPFACMVTNIGKKIYAFEDTNLSLTDTLSIVSKPMLKGLGKDEEGFITLKSSFNTIHWFIQDLNHPTLYPGMNISEALSIQVLCQMIDPKNSAPMAIASVTIQLLELTTYIEGFYEGMDSLPEATKTLVVRTLSKNKCNVRLEHKRIFRETKLDIPEALYNCKLPEVEPTSFSQSMTRTYAFKVLVEVEDLEASTSRVFDIVSDVNIARTDHEELRSLVQQKHSDTSVKSSGWANRIYLDVHDRSSLDLSSIADAVYDVSDSCGAVVEKQQTSLVEGDENLLSITSLSLSSADECNLHPSKGFYDVIRRTHSTKSESIRLYYRWFIVKDDSDPGFNYVWVMPVIWIGYKLTPSFIPLTLWHISNQIQNGDEIMEDWAKVFVCGTSFRSFKPLKVQALVLPYLHPSLPKAGAIVTQGMKVSDFLMIKLTLPFFRDPKSVSDVLVKRSYLKFENYRDTGEVVEHEAPANNNTEYRTIKWADFKLSETGDEWFSDLPADVYDYKIPKIDPTFYGNYRSRDVTLSIGLDVKIESSYYPMSFEIPIQVCGEGINLNSCNITPPSYAARVKSEWLDYGRCEQMSGDEPYMTIKDCGPFWESVSKGKNPTESCIN